MPRGVPARVVPPRIVRAEPPQVAFRIAAAIAFAAVFLFFERIDDVGAGGFRPREVRVGIGHDDRATLRFASADVARLHDALAPRAAVVRRAEHDHAVAERQLRMMNDGPVGIHRLFLETECLAQPIDGLQRVAITQARNDRRRGLCCCG